MNLIESMFVVVRKQKDGSLFFDPETMSYSAESARKKAAKLDKLVPDWAASNPIVDVAEVKITAEVNDRD